ncbi:hypothetical protein F1188_20425 [Roseospira marina]|uniref:Uncharacterized protein n=1 Tax=Roseospira marina TaxID=140057 RepID=A0A5M6I383_9PROT|nr:hypothetical protein [Roseospira marina]KAA5602623.1 hypothetical protein F1188_20425 [Roseospira marina]MBB4316262.1 type VI protein secretion system component VasK [Roseospira marina]MBB5089457.1 type VI protein secretion system component VasK [Roseospira marina]
MTLTQTLIALGVLLVVLALALWRARRPWAPGPVWRVPWHLILALGLVLFLGLLAHLTSLVTGQPVRPRGLG